MTIFKELEAEMTYAAGKWGTAFDDKNTANDWAAYIAVYTGKATAMPWDEARFRANMLKVAGLALNAAMRSGRLPPRHYD